MNPFSDAELFEQFRHAALEGGEAVARMQRTLVRAARAASTEIQIAERAMRMLLVAAASSPAVLLVGPPGTGKTQLMQKALDVFNDEGRRYGFTRADIHGDPVTPEEDWGYGNLVLGETLVDGKVVSTEGELLQAIRADDWLLLDEINRADMDRIFGGLLTWLSRKRVKAGMWHAGGGADPYPVYLDWSTSDPVSKVVDRPGVSLEYIAGSDWRLLGTYNAVDAQRVFRMGQALSRRFKHIPIAPAGVSQFEEIIRGYITEDALVPELTGLLRLLYKAHFDSDEAQLGPGLFVDIPAYVEIGLAAYGPPAEVLGTGVDATPELPSDSLGSAQVSEPSQLVQQEDESGAQETSDSEFQGDFGPGEDDGQEILSQATVETTADGTGTGHSALLTTLVAEAYLSSVGSLLARMEPEVIAALGQRMIESGALTRDEWDWIRQALPTLQS